MEQITSNIKNNNNTPYYLYIFSFFVICYIFIFAFFSSYFLYEQTEKQVQNSTLNATNLIINSLESTINLTDIAILSSIDFIQNNKSNSSEILGYLKKQESKIQNNIFVTDKNGNIIYNVDLNHIVKIKDKYFFNELKINNSLNTLLPNLFIYQSINNFNLIISRRINDQNGNFNGVIFSTINNSHFEKFILNNNLKLQDNILLYYSDKSLLTKNIELNKNHINTEYTSIIYNKFISQLKINQNIGNYDITIDSNSLFEKHISYQKSQKYGFYINLGIPTQKYFFEFYQQIFFVFTFCSLVCIILLCYFKKVSIILKKQERIISSLNDSNNLALIGHYELNLNTLNFKLSENIKQIFKIHHLKLNNLNEFINLIQEEDKNNIYEQFNKSILQHSIIDIEFPIFICNTNTNTEHIIIWAHLLGRIEFSKTNIPLKIIGIIQDITERKKSEEKIKKLSILDPLTGLHNRAFLIENLKQKLFINSLNGNKGAIFFIDLDNFKTLNDTRGHDVGDCLLIEVAKRLQQNVKKSDIIARFGGDEFIIMIENLGSDMINVMINAKSLSNRIIQSIREPYLLDGSEFYITPSIGLTIFDGITKSVEDLLKEADIAMYEAKSIGKNSIQFFNPEMEQKIIHINAIQTDIKLALELNQFELYYQPQFDNNQIIGSEALIRWNHPIHGLILPGEFIQIAESSRLIVDIGIWVLKQACKQLFLWQSNPLTSNLSISVNVSAVQFKTESFVQDVISIIESSNINPKLIKLEITEYTLLKNINDTILKMEQLEKLGLSFSLDDFGTGYSSLSYLKKLPLNQLKIDQSFVRDVITDQNDAVIAQIIIILGNALGLSVLAEGVETKEQKDFLIESGCTKFQGYFFSKPLTIIQFEYYLQNNLLI